MRTQRNKPVKQVQERWRENYYLGRLFLSNTKIYLRKSRKRKLTDYFAGLLQAPPGIKWYSFIHAERHCESKASCQRTRHNTVSGTERTVIWSRHHSSVRADFNLGTSSTVETVFIKSILKSLVFLAMWLALSGAIYSRIPLSFALNHNFFSQPMRMGQWNKSKQSDCRKIKDKKAGAIDWQIWQLVQQILMLTKIL